VRVRRLFRIVVRVLLALVVAAIVWAVLVLWAYRLPPLAVPGQGELAFADVTVVNPGAERVPHRTVRVAGDRIVAVDAATPPADGDRRQAGRFVLPGLIDMHVHSPLASVPRDVRLFDILYLAHGVTTVRDTGNFDGSLPDLRRRIGRGEEPGPRIFTCGPILDGDPPVWPGSRVVRNPAEADAAVDDVVKAGADCIKVYEKLDAATLAAIRTAAARHGRPVVGHVPRAVPFEDAHLDDVQHLTGSTLPLPLPLPVNLPAETLKTVDDARMAFIVRVSREQGIAHTPTLVMLHRLAGLGETPPRLDHPSARLLPRYYRDVVWRAPSEVFRGLREELPRLDRLVLRLHEAGVRIHAGSDTLNPFVVPGASLHDELDLLVRAGLSPEAAWAAATRNAGTSLGKPGLGTVAVDAPADLLVFRADPTRDLTNFQTLEAVVAQGRLYPRATLDTAVTGARAMFDGPVADAVSMALTRMVAASLPKPNP
jgi:imidazolonepropionase-like amidohydrolase